MSPKLAKVRYLDGFRLELTFTDGVQKVVDFTDELRGRGGVWEPLHDPRYFRQARVQAGALTWPNDVDYCPDVLYALATGRAIDSPEQRSQRAAS